MEVAIGPNEILDSISGFPKISLEEMGEVRLMNRKDIKYVVKSDDIPKIISLAGSNYFVQEIDNKKIANYETQYLDTSDLILYHQHMNGKLNRFKWRIRSYLDSDISFLEIKKKTNTGRTRKKRILIEPDELAGKLARNFILSESDMMIHDFRPVLQNKFERVTLVNRNKSERLTIDFNITFTNFQNGESASLPNLGIIEIKHDGCCESGMQKQLAGLRIKKYGLSKYCLGIALTARNIKQNSYKPKIRYLQKLNRKT